LGAKLGQNNVKGERTRIAIVEAAEQVFAEAGYRGSSLATIAERAGVTQSGLLHHFRTKEELLRAVLQELDGAESALLARPLSRGGLGVVEGLRDSVVEHAANRVTTRLLAVLVAEGTAVEHPAHDQMRERYERLRNRLIGSLSVGLPESAALEGIDLEQLANVLIALMDGIRLQWIYNHDIDLPAAFDLMATVLAAALSQDSRAIPTL